MKEANTKEGYIRHVQRVIVRCKDQIRSGFGLISSNTKRLQKRHLSRQDISSHRQLLQGRSLSMLKIPLIYALLMPRSVLPRLL